MKNLIRHRVSHRRYTAAVERGTEAFERLQERFGEGKPRVKVDRVEKPAGCLEVTFRVTGPAPDHDLLMTHMLQDAAVHRFSRVGSRSSGRSRIDEEAPNRREPARAPPDLGRAAVVAGGDPRRAA